MPTTLPRRVKAIRNSLNQVTKKTRVQLNSLPRFGGVRTVVWVATGLLLVALLYLAQFSNASLLARSLRVKQNRIAELDRANAQLRYEIAAATSPASIEVRARKLGLAPAKTVVYTNLPQLRPDRTQLMPSYEPPAPLTLTTPLPTPWDQVLALFGLGGSSDRAQAQGN